MTWTASRFFLVGVLFVSSFGRVLHGATHVTTTSIPGGTVGQPYSVSLIASGGSAPYSWSVSAGSLPGGLSLSSGGTLSGSPTSSGTFNFTVKVVSASKNGESDTQPLTLAVVPALVISTSTLPAGQAGVAYSQTLQASGGTAPYTWSISAGALPAGLNLSAGQISGTPTASGTANFSVTLVDASSVSVTKAFSIAVSPAALSIMTSSLPAGQVGVFYSQSLQAVGGAGGYAWLITAGSLPEGLSLNFTGQISGTPTASGTSNFTVRVGDTGSGTTTRALSINITSAVSITTPSLPGGQVGVAYSQTLQASGGTGVFTWSISSGTLPQGLTLSTSGRISGTPSASSTASFSVRALDSANASSIASFSISIAPALSSAGCPAGTGVVGLTYNATLNASGGTPPYGWTVVSGQLPGGVSLNSSLGQMLGIPLAAGTFNFGLKVSDQSGASVTSNCTLVISAAAPSLTISTASLPDGLIGNSYAQTLSAAGGQSPYSWTLSNGALPPGLGINGVQISGVPTAAGTFQFTIRVTDAAAKTATKDFTIRIGATLTIVTSSLASLRTGVASPQQLSASGGTPPYLWTVVSGALPAGITLSSAGLISGTPGGTGNYSFTARVTDAGGIFAERTFALAVTASLGITACPASNATQGQSYGSTPVAAGGQTPYTWTLASGTLPGGVLFNSTSGGLSGIPADSGTFPFTLLLTDKAGATATRDCQLVVTSSLIIGTRSLPDSSQSAPYVQTLLATGGKPPYIWTITSGALPTGLSLTTEGAISGVAVPLGTFSFTVTARDANGASVQQTLSLRVVTGLNVSSCPATVSEVGLLFDSPMLALGGSAPYAWKVSAGSLPAGLVLDPVSGGISGKPVQAGTFQFTVDVTDLANRLANRQCSIEVANAVSISTTSFRTGSTSSAYSDTIVAAGGVAPFVWSTTAGALPPGLTLNAGSGHITGNPLVVGTFSFTAKVIDGIGGQATKDLSIVISQGLTIPDCPVPAASVGLSYSALLTAVGGSIPYQWRIESGALPAGLTLNSGDAAIGGTPAQPGVSTFVLRVDDANGKTTTRLCSIQVNSPSLTITSSPSLPNGLVATAYSQKLAATGGRAPYSWSITSSGAPAGISLNGAGTLSGVAGVAGTFSFTVQVTDQDNNVARQIVTLAILAGNPPNVLISGLPDIVDPAQQPTFTLQLDSEYPAAISGTVTLVFTPDPAVGVDDPAVRFATGGRVLTFTIPPHSTQANWSAPVVAIQTGTVSGDIQLNVKLESNGTDLTPASSSRTIRVDRLAPRIVKVQVIPSSSGFEIHVTGFATTREITQGTFRFSGGTSSAPIEVVVPLSSIGAAWFQSAASGAFGGQFGLTQSFVWQGAPASTLNAVSVSLSNTQGASPAVDARF